MNTPGKWYTNLQNDDAYWVENTKIDFAIALERLMERVGINKSQLAKHLGTSPAYVSKVLRGDANLTIESMVKLARAAHGSVHIHVAQQTDAVRWFQVVSAQRESVNADIPALWSKHSQQHRHERVPVAA